MVTYTYDAWGELLSVSGTLASTVGEFNRLRYRGYYYDTESGMYYLQSRYYDPELGRFISEDDPIYHEGETGAAANLYAYCENNPVMNVDYYGYRPVQWVNRCVAVSDFSIISNKPVSFTFNCYGYAIGVYKWINPGHFSKQNNYNTYVNVDTIAKRVMDDIKALKRSGKIVSGPNYKTGSNEYLIAIRVTAKNYWFYDYHFMRRASNGQWSFKAGGGNTPVMEVGSYPTFDRFRRYAGSSWYNPGQITWNMYYKKTTGALWWKKTFWAVHYSRVYTSKIIYIAVTYK